MTKTTEATQEGTNLFQDTVPYHSLSLREIRAVNRTETWRFELRQSP